MIAVGCEHGVVGNPNMRIWIDLSNSPHALFFHPIIRILEDRGHDVRITVRDFAQTAQLADRFGLRYEIIGSHGGKAIHRKGLKLLSRVLSLTKWGRGLDIDLAVSHNSYSQALAASLLGIPFAAIEDYEYQPAHHISFRLARRVIVPEVFPEDALRLYGAAERKVKRYSGSKEQIYLSSFVPNPAFLSDEGLNKEKIIVTVRPPATFALYHRFENPIFDELMEWLGKRDDVLLIMLPRTDDQKAMILKSNYRNVFIPPHALDGPNLLFHSDLVISAGGTMNREGAVLGTPTYTVFAGTISAVDAHLIRSGRMMRIQEKSDIVKIKLRKKEAGTLQLLKQSSLQTIVELILSVPGITVGTST